jgi:hypothetical protein
MDTHKNARLTPKDREEMVRAVVDCGLSKVAAACRWRHGLLSVRQKSRNSTWAALIGDKWIDSH